MGRLFKVIATKDDPVLYDKWNQNSLSFGIIGTRLYTSNHYLLDCKTCDVDEIIKVIAEKNKDYNNDYVYLYSNHKESEISDLVTALENAPFNTVLFLKGEVNFMTIYAFWNCGDCQLEYYVDKADAQLRAKEFLLDYAYDHDFSEEKLTSCIDTLYRTNTVSDNFEFDGRTIESEIVAIDTINVNE